MRRRALTLPLALAFFAGCASNVPAPEWQVEGPPPPQKAAGLVAFPDDVAAAPAPPAPPLRLTASDGTGLRLTELTADAVVEDPLAFTELHLTFDNPEDRRLEGTFTITLPEGAALGRFAMKIGDEWQEGEVVEKQGARKAYEDFLHRKQDPALLEQAPGNEFSARVFPIPARGRKEIIVSYSQELGGGKPYMLPLRGLPELGRLRASVSVAGQAQPAVRIERERVTPEDVRLEARVLGGGAGLRSGNLVLARVRPVPAAEADPLAASLILVDTSASRALGFAEEIGLVSRLVRRIAETAGPGTPVAVGAFDQTAETVFEGQAGAFGEQEARALRARQAFGASSLGAAIGWAEARAQGRRYKRIILLGDGVATAGETDAAQLAARAAALKAEGVERIDAVVLGGLRDEGALRKLVTAGLARDGVVADGGLGFEAIERRLSLATRSGIPVTVEGARWQWPTVLDGVQAGDEVLVYADLPEGQPARVSVGGAASPALDLRTVERPLLERSWAKAKIQSLLDGGDAKGDVAQKVVALSTAYRVLSPYTSLLVLETEADFARFRIDRKALADVLTVSSGKLALSRPSAPTLLDGRPATTPRVANADPPATAASPWRSDSLGADPLSARGNMWGDPVGEASGSGGLGLTGIGQGGGGRGEGIGLGGIGTLGHGASVGAGQGFGSGHGRLGGAHRVEPPQVRTGTPQVSGRIPPEVIQRVVRQSFGRFRLCYEHGLREKPDLAGRMAVRFVIQRDGTVAQASVTDLGTLTPEVASCVARAFYALSFPEPDGGMITVTYPLTFGPDSPAPRSAGRTPAHLPIEVPRPPGPPSAPPPPPPEAIDKRAAREPYTGRFKSVMDLLSVGGPRTAMETAYAWHREAPGDVMALVALGEALEGAHEPATAARVYGSIVDLFPARADLRRFAGERLERLGEAGAGEAIDTFRKAEEERPDHPQSHRLLAYALLRRGDFAGSFAAAERGLHQGYPRGRFAGVEQILREDLGLVAAAWIKAEPGKREEILSKLIGAGGTREEAPSLRFVLSWETDANDVDFHVHDAEGNHAYYKSPELASGGRLYADVTTGYGPECFTIRLPREKRSARYKLEAHYYSRGPMGYGMGKLEIVDHDGQGGITFSERPFVVMADGAFVDLGTFPG